MKDMIKNQVFELSIIEGLKKLTMSKIASSLKISKKTIYEHFDNKERLINEMLDDYIEKNYKTLDQELEESTNVIEQLKIASFLFLPFPFEFYKNNIEEIQLNYPERYLELQTLIKYKTDKIIEIYTKGVNLGVFESNINPLTIAFISQSFVKMTYEVDKPLDLGESQTSLFESFYEILLYGCVKH